MKQTLQIYELPPGLNGSNGLMQMHWSKYRKLKERWLWLIKSEKPAVHEGMVEIRFTRYSTAPMDYDNLGASFKPIGDALEDCGIIEDDSPNTINKLILQWKKALSRKEQGVTIEIEDVK